MSAHEAPKAAQATGAEIQEDTSTRQKESNSLETAVQTENKEGTNGGSEKLGSHDAKNPKSAPDAPEPQPRVHVSAHERDREEQASRRVEEAQKYNNRNRGDGAVRGGFRGGRGGRGGYRNNNRFDPSKQEKSDDPIAIRKQVEFYFSESNLLTDRFLFERVEGHKNVPVPIDVIRSFKRMQHFQPREAVVEALKESAILDIVDDDTAIQRKEPLPEGLIGKSMDEVQRVHEDRSMVKSVYAKGFGDEKSTTQFDIEAWFANHGLTNSVRLRRDANKGFKGSVFVEFDTEETQQKFLSLDPPPKWKGKELVIKSKKQYCDGKVEDINSGRIRRNSPNPRYDDQREKRPRRGSPTYDSKRPGYAEGDDTRDWRQRRTEEAANGHRDYKHKDYGSSGRRDRGGRGSKGGRDWDEDRERKEKDGEKPDSSDTRIETPEAPAEDDVRNKDSTAQDQAIAETETLVKDTNIAEEAANKKRAREDDEIDEDLGRAKKIDMKEGSE